MTDNNIDNTHVAASIKGVEFSEKDLYCIARHVQSALAGSEYFLGCSYCKYLKDCNYNNHDTLKRLNQISDVCVVTPLCCAPLSPDYLSFLNGSSDEMVEYVVKSLKAMTIAITKDTGIDPPYIEGEPIIEP